MRKEIKESGIKTLSILTENLRKWIRKFDSGKVWINRLESESTIDTYLKRFKKYCDLTGLNPDELLHLKLTATEISIKVMTAIHNNEEVKINENEAEELYADILKNQIESQSQRANFSVAVNSFYKHNKRSLNEPLRFNPPIAKGRRPTLEEIELMLSYTQNKRDEALILTQSSCPLREGTLELMRFWGFD